MKQFSVLWKIFLFFLEIKDKVPRKACQFLGPDTVDPGLVFLFWNYVL